MKDQAKADQLQYMSNIYFPITLKIDVAHVLKLIIVHEIL